NVVDVFSGIKDNTEVIINTETFEGSGEHTVHKIDATGIALDMLGRNIVNTIILGYFAKKTNVVSIDSLLEVIKETFPGKVGELNAEATKKAYDIG
ncbi:2-oxoacid:acceptor oxidoreductase family protein, partial [Methanobrevibacter sp.]|uniref:2-oxoacid:acceptor oxidoreductase family protein n=1 Tax=Methanobrevibacter sp. TaxID=66852 RepID=UPI0025E3FAB2